MIRIIGNIYATKDLPLVYVSDLRALVLSDLHLGYEEEMSEKGIFLPKMQLKRILTIIDEALKEFKVEKIILNGDIKHSFSSIRRTESEDLKIFLNKCEALGLDVIAIRGNHDNYLKNVLARFPRVKFYENYYEEGEYVFTHGHQKIDKQLSETKLIIGHEHPRITIRSRISNFKAACFFLVPYKNMDMVVLPASGYYQSGSDIIPNSVSYLSPYLKENDRVKEGKPFIIIENYGILEMPPLYSIENLLI